MAATEFQLHTRLAADCRPVGDLPLCRLLVMNDRRFPWGILVPRIGGLTELHHLPSAHRPALLEEIEAVSTLILETCGSRKINVGALGNLVAQLHVHVVGRAPGDSAWPGPVWGSGEPRPYRPEDLDALCSKWRTALGV